MKQSEEILEMIRHLPRERQQAIHRMTKALQGVVEMDTHAAVVSLAFVGATLNELVEKAEKEAGR
jgi:hypothetical protein